MKHLLFGLSLTGILLCPADVSALDWERAFLKTECPEKIEFKPGEKMEFRFSLANSDKKIPNGKYFLVWNRLGDDGLKQQGREDLGKEGPLLVTTSLDRPGFVRITAKILDSKGNTIVRKNKNDKALSFTGGAGVQLERIRSVSPEPADFDVFWKKQKAKLARVPVNARLTLKKTLAGNINLYAVKIDCAGPRPVTGYMTIPKNGALKSMPACVRFDGYGTTVQTPLTKGAQEIYFSINAHGYDLERDSQYYKDFFKGISRDKYGYAFHPGENSDPEKAYFNGMALRIMRALEYVKTRPEWNGKLYVRGGSQGGLQAIWAGGLDPDVKTFFIEVPWCCNLGDTAESLRMKGWNPAGTQALLYYDPANFAKRIQGKFFVTIGAGDHICPPSGILGMFNQLKCDKVLTIVQGMDHGWPVGGKRFTFKK